jgi:hypothetical protein
LGDSGREDAVDNILKLSKPENYMDDGAFFNIGFDKARNADPADGGLSRFGLKVHPPERGRGLIWTAEEISGGVDKEVVMALLIDGEWSQVRIAEEFGKTQGYIGQIKSQATKLGYLTGKGKATRATPKGRKWGMGIDLSGYYGGEGD